MYNLVLDECPHSCFHRYLGFPSKPLEDRFIKKVTHVHEQITEQSLLDGYEFMTEEDMVAAGFSESLGSPC